MCLMLLSCLTLARFVSLTWQKRRLALWADVPALPYLMQGLNLPAQSFLLFLKRKDYALEGNPTGVHL